MDMDFFHVTNRRVEGLDLFRDSQDYARFVHELYEFNDTRPADNLHRSFHAQMKDLRGLSFGRERELLVHMHGWVLMRNHYHLLVSEATEGGLVRFITKLNVGYAKYFNERHRRKGALFQGKTKKVPIKNDSHLLYVLHYMHLNPLDYLPGARKWRERDKGGISHLRKALAHLEKYRWSSYLDYCGAKNFPSLITTRFFDELHGDYRSALHDHLAHAASPETQPASLELEYDG